MLISIHQSHYIPWLRYAQKIAASDLFILLDDVAFTKNGWQNRNKIKCATGWMYLTVPVAASLNEPIRDVRIAPGNWAQKHLKTLESNYARAPYFDQHYSFFQSLYSREWTHLDVINEAILRYCLDQMEIGTPVLRSSTLKAPGAATDRLVNLCAAVGATEYCSGEYAAHEYLDVDAFERAGIGLHLQSWSCPEYRQQFPRAGFVPDLSILDLLFNEGPCAIKVLMAGGTPAAARSSNGFKGSVVTNGSLNGNHPSHLPPVLQTQQSL